MVDDHLSYRLEISTGFRPQSEFKNMIHGNRIEAEPNKESFEYAVSLQVHSVGQISLRTEYSKV